MLNARDGTLLVLGGSGFLGAHVVAAAGRRSRRRVAVASRAPRSGPRFGPAPAATRAVDAGRPGAVPELLDLLVPEAVILCAALARAADCEADPALARRLNAELPEEVARWCAGRGARLVHVSTDLVFGGAAPAGERYAEADPPSPLGGYGASKAEGEARVLAADPAAAVVRLPLLYGHSGGRGLGASDGLLAALEAGERPFLFDDEWRTPLPVESAAAALVELSERPHAGLLHVAGPDRLSRHELGYLVLAARLSLIHI